MSLNVRLGGLLLLIVLLLVASQTLFIVPQGEFGMVFRFDKVVAGGLSPGLHMKLPLLDQSRLFDNRLLIADSGEQAVTTSDDQKLTVTYFAMWRVDKPRTFYSSTSGDISTASDRIASRLTDVMQRKFATLPLKQALAISDDAIRKIAVNTLAKDAAGMGVLLVDVGIQHIGLPEDATQDVYTRMKSVQTGHAEKLRAEGRRAVEVIRMQADQQKADILANATREAAEIRGKADAKAAAIYSQAYTKAPAFFTFYRGLEAYRHALSGKDNVFLLDSNSEFLQYLKKPGK